MKKEKILNPMICAGIAELGHTELFAIGDCGLPIPKETKVIDLSLVKGVPSFCQVLEAVSSELVIEKYYYAEEADNKNPSVVAEMKKLLPDARIEKVTHEDLKKMIHDARVVIRTGEATPFANVILVGGVNF